MTSFGFRLKGERCLFQVELWNAFHLSALICSGCCCVASWPVCQRFSWRVAHRQHHHCCVIELDCFLAFEGVSVVDVATGVECCTVMGSIKHLVRSHSCLYISKGALFIYSDIWCTSDTGLIHIPWIKEQSEHTLQTQHCDLKAVGEGRGRKYVRIGFTLTSLLAEADISFVFSVNIWMSKK